MDCEFEYEFWCECTHQLSCLLLHLLLQLLMHEVLFADYQSQIFRRGEYMSMHGG